MESLLATIPAIQEPTNWMVPKHKNAGFLLELPHFGLYWYPSDTSNPERTSMAAWNPLSLALDRSAVQPLYQQIVTGVRRLIDNHQHI